MSFNRVYNVDALDGLKVLKSGSVDLILTDPPYNINYKSNHGSKEYKDRIQSHDWDTDFDFRRFFPDLWRVLKNDCFMYVFGRFENFELMSSLGCSRVLIWDKCHNGMGDLVDWGIGYEVIYVFKKGKPFLRGMRVNGVINFKHIGFFEKTIHPTQKPVGLMRYIIEKSCDEGSLVLDAFLGSGTTAVACKQTNRDWIGFELDSHYCKLINDRLQQVNLKSWF